MNRRIIVFIRIFIIIGCITTGIFGADIFGLYAPPGSISINSSYEWSREEVLEVRVEHEGAAYNINEWFLVLDNGQAPDYSIREANQGSDIIEYQVYKESVPYTNVIIAPAVLSTFDSAITSADFDTFSATPEIVSFYFYFVVDSGQFLPSGSYGDTLVLSLYSGTPASYTLEDSVSVAVSIRMAELMDIYMDREPGITSLDLVTPATDMLIATTHERSNSTTGYTVSISSENLTAYDTGHTEPYFLHETLPDFIEYSLTYGGSAVLLWSGGASFITDSGTTWLDKELRITYGSGADMPSGYYRDRLTLTIMAQ